MKEIEENNKISNIPCGIPFRFVQEVFPQYLDEYKKELVEKIEKQDWECFEQIQIKKDIINLIKE